MRFFSDLKRVFSLQFFDFGKNWKFDNPNLIWEKFEIGKISNFGNPPSGKNISLKHLELPKNHFKTKLFFFSTEAFTDFIYISKKIKI